KAHIHEHLLTEQIIQKLPESLSHSKDTLFAKRPLTCDVVKEHLQAKISDSTTINILESITVKTESALAATTIFCSNGIHNPATSHTESKCWQLHPELKKSLRRSGKKQAKAAITGNNSDSSSTVPSDSCYFSVSKQQAYSAYSKTTMFLDSGCSDHLFPKKEFFTGYKPMSSQIEIANRKSIKIEGSGYVEINDSHGALIKVKALHVPRIVQPLISKGRLFCKGCVVKKPDMTNFNSPNSE
ncbi:uncharacterized protein VP01_5717g1, partial [Puccinia sorghi]